MIVVMNPGAADAAIDRVIAEIEKMGNHAHLSRGQFRTVIGAVGEEGSLNELPPGRPRRGREGGADPQAVQVGQPGIS